MTKHTMKLISEIMSTKIKKHCGNWEFHTMQ